MTVGLGPSRRPTVYPAARGTWMSGLTAISITTHANSQHDTLTDELHCVLIFFCAAALRHDTAHGRASSVSDFGDLPISSAASRSRSCSLAACSSKSQPLTLSLRISPNNVKARCALGINCLRSNKIQNLSC
jgi:hypothetical protein